MESEKNEVVKPLIWASLLAIGMFVGAQLDDELPADMAARQAPHSELDRLEDAIGFVKNKYGEPLSDKALANAGIKSIIEHLDPHSYYLEGSQFDYFNDRVKGDYSGVGIEYKVIADTVIVSWVREGAPAKKAGIAMGDVIWSIDSVQVSGNNLVEEEIYDAWKSEKAEILLSVQKQYETTLTEHRLRKEQIPMESVPIAYMIRDSVGYIKISRFSSGTYREFMENVERLAGEGIRDLIVDVRDNPGGSLDQTVKIIDQFIEEKDQLLVYLEGAHMSRMEYHSTANVFFKIRDLVVLINENSVSASEILAGSLQDLNRATIVGRRTFGKALVQETFQLDQSSAINLSIGRYYLPSGRHIQRSYDNREAYDEEPAKRKVNGELFIEPRWKADSLNFIVSPDGRELALGSGVYPDIFVAADSLTSDSRWPGIQNRFEDYAFLQFLHHREDLATPDYQETIVADFLIEDTIANDLNRSMNLTYHLSDELKRLQIQYKDSKLSAAQFELKHDPAVEVALEKITAQD